MALKPACGKKCGEAAKNYSNNKDCKICTPVHNCTNPCPKGTVLCRRLVISYCLPTYTCQRMGLIWWQISQGFPTLSPKHSQLTQEQFLCNRTPVTTILSASV